MCLSQKLYEIEKLHRDREITSTFYQQILAVTIDRKKIASKLHEK
jgi:hypothetical protein